MPGAFIERRALPSDGTSVPAPISQSAFAAVWFRWYCFTSEPNTSEMLSFSAPDCLLYSSPAVNWVTPWVSSWPMTSRALVRAPTWNRWPLPSP